MVEEGEYMSGHPVGIDNGPIPQQGYNENFHFVPEPVRKAARWLVERLKTPTDKSK